MGLASQVGLLLAPRAELLLEEVGHLPLHPAAQLLLTTVQTTRPAVFAHALEAMALAGALAAAQAWDRYELRLALLGTEWEAEKLRLFSGLAGLLMCLVLGAVALGLLSLALVWLLPAPWQVRNQARMHVWKGLPQHKDTSDSMVYWLETVTSVGVRLEEDDSLTVLAPLGTDDLLGLVCRPTAFGRTRRHEYDARIAQKRWAELWPKVRFLE